MIEMSSVINACAGRATLCIWRGIDLSEVKCQMAVTSTITQKLQQRKNPFPPLRYSKMKCLCTAIALPLAEGPTSYPTWAAWFPSSDEVHKQRAYFKPPECTLQPLSQNCGGFGALIGGKAAFLSTPVTYSRKIGYFCRAEAVAANVSEAKGESGLCFEAVVFDMDGTMTVSNIDFKEMRLRTGIPVGDLFTVMESWEDSGRVDQAYEVILQMEAQACATLELQPGLSEVLELLRGRGAKIALVTRNTMISVDAFFDKVGEEWRDVFSIILTREFRFVKPDKRLLLHVAEQWGLPPSSMLMVGDSREDVECGNAAGTATCLVQGGGNEVAGGATPTGAQPTYTIRSLWELRSLLADAGSSVPETSHPSAGSRIPGLSFADALFASGVLRGAYCSYPRLAGAFGGLAASTYPGDRVLHLGCEDGGLTKLLASQGVRVEGLDGDANCVEAAVTRGLSATLLQLDSGPNGPTIRRGALGTDDSFDVVISYSESSSLGDSPKLEAEQPGTPSLPWGLPMEVDEIWRVLKLGGRYAMEHRLVSHGGSTDAAVTDALEVAARTVRSYRQNFLKRGFVIGTCSVEEKAGTGVSMRLVASKPGLQKLM